MKSIGKIIHLFQGRYILLCKLCRKLLLAQKLHSINDDSLSGRRVDSFQAQLQHSNEAFVRVMVMLCINFFQGGHGEVKVNANVLPPAYHCVVEGIHQVLYCGNHVYMYTWIKLLITA